MGCVWCNNVLPKGRRKYCSDECSYEYWRHNYAYLWWNIAKELALERAQHKCEKCGTVGYLEVHHKEHLGKYEERHNSPKNRQENLVALCRKCHEEEHHLHIRSEHERVRLQSVMNFESQGTEDA